MLRSVVGEEGQLKTTEDRLLRLDTEIGILIGKILDHRAFVYTLVPTPPTDSGQPPCRIVTNNRMEDHESTKTAAANNRKSKNNKGSASKSTINSSLLDIDTEWVGEHARQVSRMLLGGMDVVGIYLWASQDSFKASTPILCQTIKAAAHAASSQQFHQQLLLHISNQNPRRWICRISSPSSTNTTSNLHPCDFKMAKLLPSLHSFTSTYNFHFRLPIFSESQNPYTFKDAIQFAITYLAKELKPAKAMIDGKLVTEDMQFNTEGAHEVELLLPFMNEPPELCKRSEVLGHVIFSGAVCAFAYLGSRAPMSQVISDIKMDIITSLQSRLEIICEEIEGDTRLPLTDVEKASNGISVDKSESQLILHEMRKPCSLLFPKRVFIPWLSNVFICDYLKQLDTFEDVKYHCKEMLSMEVSTESKMLEPEKEAKDVMGKSLWDWDSSDSASAADCLTTAANCAEGNKNDYRSKHLKLNILVITICIVLLSVFTAWVIKYFG